MLIDRTAEEVLAEQDRWLKTSGAQEHLRVFGADGSVRLSAKFEPRDLWVGVYWARSMAVDGLRARTLLDVYVCIVPCLRIIVRVVGRWRRNPNIPEPLTDERGCDGHCFCGEQLTDGQPR